MSIAPLNLHFAGAEHLLNSEEAAGPRPGLIGVRALLAAARIGAEAALRALGGGRALRPFRRRGAAEVAPWRFKADGAAADSAGDLAGSR